VHLILLDDARQSPVLLADILDEGRVIVDRSGGWKRLSRQRNAVLRAAAAEEGAIHAGARAAVAEARARLDA
jgi:hypothetical protein